MAFRSCRIIDCGKDGKIRGAKVHTEKSQIERLYPLELWVDKKEPVPAILSEAFRAKRDAAVAAKLRVQDIADDITLT